MPTLHLSAPLSAALRRFRSAVQFASLVEETDPREAALYLLLAIEAHAAALRRLAGAPRPK